MDKTSIITELMYLHTEQDVRRVQPRGYVPASV